MSEETATAYVDRIEAEGMAAAAPAEEVPPIPAEAAAEEPKPKQTLQAMVDDKIEVLNLIQSLDGELSPLMEAFLADVEKNLETKVDRYVIQEEEFKLQAEYMADLAEKFARKAKAIEAAGKQLRMRIKITMETLKKTELNGVTRSYKLVNAADKVVINDAVLSNDYKMYVTPEPFWQVDRERVKALLEAGDEIEGAHIEPVTYVKAGITKKPALPKPPKEKKPPKPRASRAKPKVEEQADA